MLKAWHGPQIPLDSTYFSGYRLPHPHRVLSYSSLFLEFNKFNPGSLLQSYSEQGKPWENQGLWVCTVTLLVDQMTWAYNVAILSIKFSLCKTVGFQSALIIFHFPSQWLLQVFNSQTKAHCPDLLPWPLLHIASWSLPSLSLCITFPSAPET